MPRFTQLQPKPTAYEAPKAFERPYYERQQMPNTAPSAKQAGATRWALPIRPATLGPVVTPRRPASPMGVKQRQRPTSAGPTPHSTRRTSLALGGQRAAPEMQLSRGHAPTEIMAVGVNPKRIAELEQQNEILHAAYGGARAQYETALKAVRSAAAASREQAEKLQKAEDRAARAERLIQALTAALVRSERDALVVASELSAAEEALASRAREAGVQSRDAITAAMQVIADALHAPVVFRGARTGRAELPYGEGLGPADPSLQGAALSERPAESSRGLGDTSIGDVSGAQQTRDEPSAAEATPKPEEPPAASVATGAAPAHSVPGTVELSDAVHHAEPLSGGDAEADRRSVDAAASSKGMASQNQAEPLAGGAGESAEAVGSGKAMASQVVSSTVASALGKVGIEAPREDRRETAVAEGEATRAGAEPASGAEKGDVASKAGEGVVAAAAEKDNSAVATQQGVMATAADLPASPAPHCAPIVELDDGAKKLIRDSVSQAIARVLRRFGEAQGTAPVAAAGSAAPLKTDNVVPPGARTPVPTDEAVPLPTRDAVQPRSLQEGSPDAGPLSAATPSPTNEAVPPSAGSPLLTNEAVPPSAEPQTASEAVPPSAGSRQEGAQDPGPPNAESPRITDEANSPSVAPLLPNEVVPASAGSAAVDGAATANAEVTTPTHAETALASSLQGATPEAEVAASPATAGEASGEVMAATSQNKNELAGGPGTEAIEKSEDGTVPEGASTATAGAASGEAVAAKPRAAQESVGNLGTEAVEKSENAAVPSVAPLVEAGGVAEMAPRDHAAS